MIERAWFLKTPLYGSGTLSVMSRATIDGGRGRLNITRLALAVASVAVLALPAASAFAQDGTYMNPADVGAGLVMPSAIHADAKRREAARSRSSRRGGGNASAEEVCGQLSSIRARRGANDPNYRQLVSLCRQGGFTR